MKLGIQVHLAGLSISDTNSVLERLGVERARSTVHSWVHKADLQHSEGRSTNRVAIDETMIRHNRQWHWLYISVDSVTNDILHTKLQPARNHCTAKDFFHELVKKHDINDSLFLVNGHFSLHGDCRYRSLRFRIAKHENRNSVEGVFREVKRRTQASSNSFSNGHIRTADGWVSYTNRRFVCS